MPPDAARRASLHRRRGGPRRRDRDVRRADRPVRAGRRAFGGRQATTAIVVTAGLAEVAAGSIAMGLGGFLAARSDAEHFASEKLREEQEVEAVPDLEEVRSPRSSEEYGLSDEEIAPILRAFRNNHPAWVDFMMRFELGLEEPDPRRALGSA